MPRMSAPPAQRRGEQEAGFTLIELMVVVLIIGILIAIALPTFLGARTRAQNRAAQTELRSAYVAASTYYAANETYTGFDVAAAQLAEPAVTWVAGGAAPALDEVTIEVAPGQLRAPDRPGQERDLLVHRPGPGQSAQHEGRRRRMGERQHHGVVQPGMVTVRLS